MNLDAIMEAQQAAASGYTLLGRVAYASLSGNRIAHDRLVALATEAGVPDRYLPSEPSAKGAFGAAWHTLRNRVGDGFILRYIGEEKAKDGVVAVGLVREDRDLSARDLDYDPLVVVTFVKDTHDLVFSEKHPGAPSDFEPKLRAAYAYYREHTTAAIRGILAAFFAETSTPLKPGRGSGGVYFVPETHARTLESVVRLIESIPGARNACGALPIPDTSGTRAQMAESAAGGLGEEIRQAEAALAAFDFDKARESTLTNRLAEYEAIHARVSMFAGVLSLKAGDLTSRLAALKARVAHVLNGGSPETAPEVTIHEDGPISDAAAAAKAIEAFDEAAGF